MKKVVIGIVLLFLISSPTEISGQMRSKHKPKRQNKTTRPLELTGSKEQRVRQNLRAIGLGLPQILTDEDLKNLASDNVLAELNDNDFYFIDRTGPRTKYRKGKKTKIHIPQEKSAVHVRLWVKNYLDNQLGPDYLAEFHKKFKITANAGARSLERQNLMRKKGSPFYTPYAAQAEQPLEESLHVRGIVIDISRRGMGKREIEWMRKRLIADKINGISAGEETAEEGVEIDPIEENVCFHIVVFPKKNNPLNGVFR